MSWAEVSTPDGPMRIYQAAPRAQARGAVIVVQEAFGVNHHIQSVADRFAAEGWHAAAPEFFHRSGEGADAPYDDFSKVIPLYQGVSDPGVLIDLEASLGHLYEQGFAEPSIGIVGFCWGGRVAFLAALRKALGAAVSFYGGGIVTARFPQFPPLADEAGSLRTPWLGLFGDKDESIPVDDVERLRTALESAQVDHDIIRYTDAGHGFHCDARPDHYYADAAKDAWGRTLAWFDSQIKQA
jgi:carboxymethylenebutenolidase